MKKPLFKKGFTLRGALNERGNLGWWIVMMPVFLAAMGMAVDMANVQAVRTTLQSSLDSATQGAVANSQNQASGKPRYLNSNDARKEVLRLYDINRTGLNDGKRVKDGIPFLICQKSGTKVVIPDNSKCGFKVTDFKYHSSGGLDKGGYLTVTVQEKADTIFLKILGFEDLTYTFTSTARLTNTHN